jgi:hypothetical protein
VRGLHTQFNPPLYRLHAGPQNIYLAKAKFQQSGHCASARKVFASSAFQCLSGAVNNPEENVAELTGKSTQPMHLAPVGLTPGSFTDRVALPTSLLDVADQSNDIAAKASRQVSGFGRL